MKKSFLLLFIVALSACNSGRKVELLNGLFFNMHEGEVLEKVNTLNFKDYSDLVEAKQVQLPLFKYIKARDYNMYIGMPINTSVADLVTNQLLPDSLMASEKSDNISYGFKSFVKDSVYISEYFTKRDEGFLYVLSLTPSKKVADSLFNYTALSERIIKK